MNRTHRLIAAVLALFTLLSVVSAGAFLILTADHFCTYLSCPICAARIAARFVGCGTVLLLCAAVSTLQITLGAFHRLRSAKRSPVVLKVQLLN